MPTFEITYGYTVQFGVKVLANADTQEQAERAVTALLRPIEAMQHMVNDMTELTEDDESEATFIKAELLMPQSNEHFIGTTEITESESEPSDASS